ncbi:hypothetical protein J4G07_18295, partial [Candidatus Poribacteria bacterium]|nr:hypothetical protein [Candidatus Poribacteria bacterium]
RETGFSPLLVDLGGIQPSQPQSMKPHSFEEVVCDILNACSVSETDVIIDTLADKHGSRSEVFEALTFLSKLSEIGVLFSPDQPEIESPPCGERPKIFLTAGILENRKNLRKSRLNLGIIHSRILLDP